MYTIICDSRVCVFRKFEEERTYVYTPKIANTSSKGKNKKRRKKIVEDEAKEGNEEKNS